MKEKKISQISEIINTTLNVNIFENSRKRQVVDARSLFCYILRKDLNYTLHQVKDYFNENGKIITHCTVFHSVKLFEQKKHLHELRNTIMQTVDPKYNLLKRIEEIKDIKTIERITNCVNYNE